MNEVKYVVNVPPNVYAGDYFNVQLGPQNKVYTVRCPDGSGPGSLVDIRVAQTTNMQPVYTVSRVTPPAPEPTSDANILSLLYTQSTVLLVLFILLTLAYALPQFAVQSISSGCNAVNPADGSTLYSLYYNLFKGLGSNKECTAGPRDFCISWSDYGVWSRIDSVTSLASSMQSDARFAWEAAQVMVPLSSVFCLLSLLNISFLIYLIRYKMFNRATIGSTIACSCTLVVLAWVFSFSGLNSLLYSSTLSPTIWSSFYRAGYPLKAVIENAIPATTPIPIGNCSVSIGLSDSGIILSIATSVAFVTSLILCCVRCGIRY